MTSNSVRPGEGDLVEGTGAEPFRGPRNRLAAERPVETDRVKSDVVDSEFRFNCVSTRPRLER